MNLRNAGARTDINFDHLSAEARQAVAAERERIRDLAVTHMATYWHADGITGRGERHDFDELIGDPL